MADQISIKGKPPRPEWLDEYDLVGKIGEGTYGLVYLARNKDKPKSGNRTAIKKFKQSKEGDGVSPTAIREIMLLRECTHENIVKLVNVHINHHDMSLYLAFDYAEHDLYEIIRHHREKLMGPIKEYTVKSLLWQILNGLNYLHSNWIIHRDLKPSNILVMGEGEEQGVVKIGDFGLARIFQAPLKPLSDNGVVVTIWYRSPELLLGSKHYTCAVDMWAVGCIFAELLTLKPLFQGVEDKSSPNPFQVDQLDKIFRVLGHPTIEKWSALQHLPHWQSNRQLIQARKYEQPALGNILPIKGPAIDLLNAMLEYNPKKRITAAQALEHDYFRTDPLPGKNAFVGSHQGDKVVNYPNRPVDQSTDFDGHIHPQPVTQHQIMQQMPPSSSSSSSSSSAAAAAVAAAAMASSGIKNLPSMGGLQRGGGGGGIPGPPSLGALPGGSGGVGGGGGSTMYSMARGMQQQMQQENLQQQQQQHLQQARAKERSMQAYASGQYPPNKSRRL